MAAAAERPKRVRRRRRWLLLLALSLGYGLLCVRDVRLATAPVDAVVNLLPTPAVREQWRAPGPSLVVLQHGLSRSSWSMWRLERALRQHGHEVLNLGYASTDGRLIEDYAADLHAAVRARLDAWSGPPPRLSLVGHSMGGLVIRAALRRGGLPRPAAVVFVGTPQRGAALAVARQDSWAFQLFLGAGAALQLRPGDPFYAGLGVVDAQRIGVIHGQAGDAVGWNDDIPGDDDRTVAVAEAQLPEATATIGLKIGHFRLGFDVAVVQEVLGFLATGQFPGGG